VCGFSKKPAHLQDLWNNRKNLSKRVPMWAVPVRFEEPLKVLAKFFLHMKKDLLEGTRRSCFQVALKDLAKSDHFQSSSHA
jgi:hypothetical protein